MAFGDQRELEIVLRARDEASKVIKQVGDTTEEQNRRMTQSFKEAGVMAAGMIASLGLLGRSAVANAASYEQNRIAFESMLGSADKARKLLKQVSDFAQATPFELPQVVQGSRQLLAYGIEAKNIIPTFKTLGDIASGVGTDKMPQLIMAFGQVKAATKLTGMELRQFTEAGVPLLDALVKKANESGGSLVTMGGSAKKARVDTKELNDQLAITRQKLDEATKSGKAKQSTLMSLRNTIENYEGKLKSASASQGTFTTRVKVTKEQMLDLISKGAVSFDQVQQALQGMTDKGGLFFEGMVRQSKSFNGVMSNVSDSLGKFVREVVGINDQGDIRDGSLFARLKDGAEGFLATLERLRPQVTRMVNGLMENRQALIALAGAFGGVLLLAVGAFVVSLSWAIALVAAFVAAGAGLALILANVREHFFALTPVIALAGAAVYTLMGGFSGLWALMLANPVTAVIAVLSAAALGVGYLATQTDFLKSKDDLLRDAQDRLKQSTQELTDHQQTLEGYYRQLDGLALSLERGQRSYNDAVKRFGPDSLEAREAMHNIKEVQGQFSQIQRNVNSELDKTPAILKNHDKALRESQKPLSEFRSSWDNIGGTINWALGKLGEFAVKSAVRGGGIPALGGMFRFAEGTNFAPGGLALVGERGPEIVNLPRGSQVIPNERTQGLLGGTAITIGPVYVRDSGDIDSIAHRLAFQYQTRGNR